MKLRWYQEMNRIAADEVIAARERGSSFPLMTIKTMLQERTEPCLQYFDEEQIDSDTGKYGVWLDVPFVVEYREGPLDFSKVGV